MFRLDQATNGLGQTWARQSSTRISTAQDREGQGRTGLGRAGQGRAGRGRAGRGRAGPGRAGRGRAAARAQTSRVLGTPIDLGLLASVHEPLQCVFTPPDSHLAVWSQGRCCVCNGFIGHQALEGAIRPMLHILNQLLELPHCITGKQSINQSIHPSIHQSINQSLSSINHFYQALNHNANAGYT